MPSKSKKSVSQDENSENDSYPSLDENNINFREVLKMHEETIIRFVESSVNSVHKRIDNILSDVQALKATANFQDDTFHAKVKECDSKIDKIEMEMRKVSNLNLQRESSNSPELNNFSNSQSLREIKDKLTDLENRSRRNNIRVDGLIDSNKETWEQTENKLKSLIVDLNIDPNAIVIERAHRIGKYDEQKNRTVVAKLLNFKDKEKIIAAAKKKRPQNIFVNEDYTVILLI